MLSSGIVSCIWDAYRIKMKAGSSKSFLANPQSIWLRKALFQIHLWVGLFVALYIVLIGITGSILVFRKELEASSRPAAANAVWDRPVKLDAAGAVEALAKNSPGSQLTFIYSPRPDLPAYVGILRGKGGIRTVAIDPDTGTTLWSEAADDHRFLRLVGQFHYFLLLPANPGLQVNGIGAALLLVLTLSGLVIWWPGIKNWKRGFVVDFSLSWKRINFDTHNVIGFWTLAIVAFWAISGVYFAWPKQFTEVVTQFSPVSNPTRRFAVTPPKNAAPRASLRTIFADATERSPGCELAAASLAGGPNAPVLVYMSRAKSRTLLEANFLYFDPYTGKHLGTWQRGVTNTAGDWIVWSMYPLHFGTQWGLAVKVIWALLGLALPALVITGVLMYWNRYFGKQWKKWRAAAPSTDSKELAAPAQLGNLQD